MKPQFSTRDTRPEPLYLPRPIETALWDVGIYNAIVKSIDKPNRRIELDLNYADTLLARKALSRLTWELM